MNQAVRMFIVCLDVLLVFSWLRFLKFFYRVLLLIELRFDLFARLWLPSNL